jgi:hypothetical protein
LGTGTGALCVLTQNFFFGKSKKILKNPEFHADFKSDEEFLKNAPKRVRNKTSLRKMIKSGKSAHFRHVFANNYFWYIFKKLFQRI